MFYTPSYDFAFLYKKIKKNKKKQQLFSIQVVAWGSKHSPFLSFLKIDLFLVFLKSFNCLLYLGLEDTQVSSSQFQEFSVTTFSTDKANKLKVKVEINWDG